MSSENDNVSASIDSLESANTEGTLLAVAMEGASASMTADEVAQNAAANAGRYLVPAGCASAQASGATVAYTLNRFSGPYGLFDLTGPGDGQLLHPDQCAAGQSHEHGAAHQRGDGRSPGHGALFHEWWVAQP